MWQRFTGPARRVVYFAQEEAKSLGEVYISTEHLLLGLLREDDNVAARVLDWLGLNRERVREEIHRKVVRGDGRSDQPMQLTPRGKQVIDLAAEEAKQLNNDHIGTEHLLLGLIRADGGLAARILKDLGVDLNRARHAILRLQDASELEVPPAPPKQEDSLPKQDTSPPEQENSGESTLHPEESARPVASQTSSPKREASPREQVGTRMLFEDEHIRLWELAVEPGESLEEHIHRLDYAYFVTTGGLLRFADADNPSEFRDVRFEDNQIAFVPVSEEGRVDKRLTNIGSTPHRNYVIEVKKQG